jgi:hypothetical protein
MAFATLTREEKIREARRLRVTGLTAKQIGERLDVPASTIRNWYLGGDCSDCGKPIDGSSGSQSSKRCPDCAHASSIVWTREAIIAKIREWTARFAEAPTAVEWGAAYFPSPELAAQIRERRSQGDWPSFKAVQERFGSWNEGVAAAGLTPRKSGGRRAHVSTRAVAEKAAA